MNNFFKSVLVFGSGHVSALEHVYIKYLKELGYQVLLFPAQDKFLAYYEKLLINKLIFRAGLSSVYKKINKEFKEIVTEFRPQVVLVFKGMELFPSTIKWLQSHKIKVVNYNPDNPYIFSGRGSGNSNVTKGIKLYDLYMSYDKSIVEQLKRDHVVAGLVPFGFDLDNNTYERISRSQEVNKACFVGSPDKDRVFFLNQLSDKGVDIDIYGNGWNKFNMHSKLQFFPAVYEDKFWETLRKYRIQLNMMRIHNLNSHNMRTFDIPGAGGIQVASYTNDHASFFEPGKEIFLYHSIDECVALIKRLQVASTQEADNLRHFARQAVVDKKYSYRDRTSLVVEEIDKLFRKTSV